ncbi:MAG: branched-chain amino acid ABC transporter permease [Bosea sp. (in: a-proteobacteria)]
MLRAFCLALICLTLASCTGSVDTDRARICRQAILPLNPDAERITIQSVTAGSRNNLVAVSYRLIGENGQSRTRVLECLFAGDGTTLNRAELVGLSSDGRPLPDTNFYLLKRFYLDDRKEPPVDPGAVTGDGLPEVHPKIAYGLQQALGALPSIAIYALLASAYALIYGLVGRIVLTFGEFAALGSVAGVAGVAITLSLAVSTPVTGVILAFAIGVLASALHGFAMGRLVLGKLRRASGQQVLIATVGLALALSEYLRLMQGAELRWLPPVFNNPWPLLRGGNFTVTVTPVALTVAAFGLAATLSLLLYLRHSAYGRAWRAVSDDAKTAALFGVDERAIYDRALLLACACSGAAGVIVTVLYGGFGFAGGFTLGLKALVAAILGGIGSVPGACLGALLIALFEMVWSSTMPLETRDVAVFTLLAVVLIARPGGLLGDAELKPRQV